MIILSSILTASTTDLLDGTRLQTIPGPGSITLEVAADLNDATNFWTMTVQLPSGETPIDTVRVPGVNPSLAGVLQSDQLFRSSWNIAQGGHPVIAFTETGTAILTYRIVYLP